MTTLSVNVIEAALRAAFGARPETSREDMDRLATALAECITVLLPAGRLDAGKLWRGSTAWHQLSARLDSIKRQAEAGLGNEGPIAAVNRLRVLAYDCQWLLTRYGPGPQIPAPADGSHKET